MGLFHNKETSFVVFCIKLVFLNTDPPLLLNTILFLTLQLYVNYLDD